MVIGWNYKIAIDYGKLLRFLDIKIVTKNWWNF